MTRRARARRPDEQLIQPLGELPSAVARVRSVRRRLGLPESLTAPEVLLNVRAILDLKPCRRDLRAYNRGHEAS